MGLRAHAALLLFLRYPVMATDSFSIVIIDRLHSFGCALRNALSSSNVTAHVFNSYGPAHLLMQSKTIKLAL
jgi:hypothetical protein